jgi:uncharacterized repeat protein (TIGR03803 family)
MKFAAVGCLAVLIFSACSQPSAPVAPQPMQQSAERALPGIASSPRLPHPVYAFAGDPDGSRPASQLQLFNGTLYGTTTRGGANDSGAVFALNQAGQERVLYSFPAHSNGLDLLYAPLTEMNGVLYGTLPSGGTTNAFGMVFSVDPATGVGEILHRFQGPPDGIVPTAGLVALNGMLYGTTDQGGTSKTCNYGCGTVFILDPTGKERALYSFQGISKGGQVDGSVPTAAVTIVNGALYGTTAFDGATGETPVFTGCGTVFEINAAGEKTMLHRFLQGRGEGCNPVGALLFFDGALYGTTSGGGHAGYGTIYKITLAGKERVLYSFAGGAEDGASPSSGLVAFNGKLYGTTPMGGEDGKKFDHGALYELNPRTNVERILYRFDFQRGSRPASALTVVGSELYGTASVGGANHNGTVFAITP